MILEFDNSRPRCTPEADREVSVDPQPPCPEARKGIAIDPPILDLETESGCTEFCRRLETSSNDEKREMLAQLIPNMRQLSMARHSCRVVQTAIQVTSVRHHPELLQKLRGHATLNELMNSPHGNHVLQKIVEVVPPSSIGFLLEWVACPGRAAMLAHHKFGCRLCERLLEHWPKENTSTIVEEIVADAEALSRHPFGNFVVQHILEHGSPVNRQRIVEALRPSLVALAQHRHASYVVQRVLECGGAKALASALMAEGSTVTAVACSRNGSFVLEHLLELGPAVSGGIRSKLLASLGELRESHFGRRVAAKLRSELGVEPKRPAEASAG